MRKRSDGFQRFCLPLSYFNFEVMILMLNGATSKVRRRPSSKVVTFAGRGTMLLGYCMVFSSSPVMPANLTISAFTAEPPESSMLPFVPVSQRFTIFV